MKMSGFPHGVRCLDLTVCNRFTVNKCKIMFGSIKILQILILSSFISNILMNGKAERRLKSYSTHRLSSLCVRTDVGGTHPLRRVYFVQLPPSAFPFPL